MSALVIEDCVWCIFEFYIVPYWNDYYAKEELNSKSVIIAEYHSHVKEWINVLYPCLSRVCKSWNIILFHKKEKIWNPIFQYLYSYHFVIFNDSIPLKESTIPCSYKKASQVLEQYQIPLQEKKRKMETFFGKFFYFHGPWNTMDTQQSLIVFRKINYLGFWESLYQIDHSIQEISFLHQSDSILERENWNQMNKIISIQQSNTVVSENSLEQTKELVCKWKTVFQFCSKDFIECYGMIQAKKERQLIFQNIYYYLSTLIVLLVSLFCVTFTLQAYIHFHMIYAFAPIWFAFVIGFVIIICVAFEKKFTTVYMDNVDILYFFIFPYLGLMSLFIFAMLVFLNIGYFTIGLHYKNEDWITKIFLFICDYVNASPTTKELFQYRKHCISWHTLFTYPVIMPLAFVTVSSILSNRRQHFKNYFFNTLMYLLAPTLFLILLVFQLEYNAFSKFYTFVPMIVLELNVLIINEVTDHRFSYIAKEKRFVQLLTFSMLSHHIISSIFQTFRILLPYILSIYVLYEDVMIPSLFAKRNMESFVRL